MSDLDFEYAIRQDVRNNPIIREVDRDRVREMWRWAAVLVGFGVVLLFSAWQQFQVLRYGYLIEEMRKQRVAQEDLQRHLWLDRAVLLAPRRIEGIATRQLRLVAPDQASTFVIERTPLSPPPGPGVVAAR